MPPLAIVAGITAAGALGGAALQARSANKATKASSEANQQALAYTKQQDMAEQARYAQAMDMYQRQWDAWNGQRMALLQRYGVDVSGMPTAAPRPSGPTAGAPAVLTPATADRAGSAPTSNLTLAAMMDRGSPRAWNDWQGYGLRQA